MKENEIRNFYENDEKKYILKNNYDFLNFLMKKKKNGYFLNDNYLLQIQNLIEKIVYFYEFKYPDNIFIKSQEGNENYEKAVELSRLLVIDQLRYRLGVCDIRVLDFPYKNRFQLIKKSDNIYCNDIKMHTFFIQENGTLSFGELNKIKEYGFLYDINGISTVEELLNRYYETKIRVDYSDLEKLIFIQKNNVEIRNKLLSLIPFALLYSKKTLPTYGYERAKKFIEEFNLEYQLDMSIDQIDEIMKKDYNIDYKKYQKLR